MRRPTLAIAALLIAGTIDSATATEVISQLFPGYYLGMSQAAVRRSPPAADAKLICSNDGKPSGYPEAWNNLRELVAEMKVWHPYVVLCQWTTHDADGTESPVFPPIEGVASDFNLLRFDGVGRYQELVQIEATFDGSVKEQQTLRSALTSLAGQPAINPSRGSVSTWTYEDGRIKVSWPYPEQSGEVTMYADYDNY